jgi:hypothetical protein
MPKDVVCDRVILNVRFTCGEDQALPGQEAASLPIVSEELQDRTAFGTDGFDLVQPQPRSVASSKPIRYQQLRAETKVPRRHEYERPQDLNVLQQLNQEYGARKHLLGIR